MTFQAQLNRLALELRYGFGRERDVVTDIWSDDRHVCMAAPDSTAASSPA